MIQLYWVKFVNCKPEQYQVRSFEEFWHTIRDRMMINKLILEWIIAG